MNTLQTVVQGLPSVIYSLLLLALLVGAFLAPQQTRAERVKFLTDALEDHALRAVTEIQQTMVDSLKDPTKPGKWDETSKAVALTRALKMFRELGSLELEQLKRLAPGYNLDRLGEVLVEGAVHYLKSRQGISLDAIPLIEEDRPTNPPAPPSQEKLS